eukprot:6196927-Pleurochrysis_carterae.AAC.1
MKCASCAQPPETPVLRGAPARARIGACACSGVCEHLSMCAKRVRAWMGTRNCSSEPQCSPARGQACERVHARVACACASCVRVRVPCVAPCYASGVA